MKICPVIAARILPLVIAGPRKGADSVEMRQKGTVYVREVVWNPVKEKGKQLNFLISGLIEYLPIGYLGLGKTRRPARSPAMPSISGPRSTVNSNFTLPSAQVAPEPKGG